MFTVIFVVGSGGDSPFNDGFWKLRSSVAKAEPSKARGEFSSRSGFFFSYCEMLQRIRTLTVN